MMGNQLAVSPSKLASLPNGHHLPSDFCLSNGDESLKLSNGHGTSVEEVTSPHVDQENSGKRRNRGRSVNYRLKWPRHLVIETPETNSETSSVASSGGDMVPKRRGRKRIRSLERPVSPNLHEDGLSASSNSLGGSTPGPGRPKGSKRRRKSMASSLVSPGDEEVDPLLAPPSYPLPNLHDVVGKLHGDDNCPFAYTWDRQQALDVDRVLEERQTYRKRREEAEKEEIVTGRGRVVRRTTSVENDCPIPKVLARNVTGECLLISWDEN